MVHSVVCYTVILLVVQCQSYTITMPVAIYAIRELVDGNKSGEISEKCSACGEDEL